MTFLAAGNQLLSRGGKQDIEEALRESEERFRGAFESAAIGMALVGQDGRWLKVNRSLCQITGYTEQELLGLTFQDITHPDDLEADLALVQQMLAGEIPFYHLEKRYFHKDGHIVWILLSVSLVRDGEGNPSYFIGQIQDITERKVAEEQLRRQQALLQNVIKHIPCAVFWKDRHSVFLGANELCARNLGLQSPAELVGKTDYDMHIERKDADFYVQCDHQVMATGEPLLHVEEVQHRADGSRAVLLTSKVPLRDAAGKIIGTIGIYTDITQRKQIEEALRTSEERYRLLFERNLAGVLMTAPATGRILACNEAMARILGCASPEELLSHSMPEFYFNIAEREALLAQFRNKSILTNHESCLRRLDGRPVWVIANLSLERGEEGTFLHGTMIDITARKHIEEQLRQSQKMDAVGQLAAGVAHDFNNLLTIINGYSDLMLQSLPAEHAHREFLEPIKTAAERSAALTRKLLAFSRKQVVAPTVVDLNKIVAEMEKMLRRTLGEDIDLSTKLEPQLCLIKADPGQLEQLLLNLVVNARDAMPQGGKLTIETHNVVRSDRYAQAGTCPYVLLDVSDTGCGMSEEVKTRIFEPFFTTKEVGKGTGLGLATVYAIVKQSQGQIDVLSEPGRGTRFHIFFPRHEKPFIDTEVTVPPPAPMGTETVLLVEDDTNVRQLFSHTLQECGYTVLQASSGCDAISLCQTYQGPLDLLVTDVVMPGLGGRQLAEHLLPLFPRLKVLYLSGYTDDAVVRYGVLQEQVHFLQKPFPLPVLVQKVRSVLDSGR